MGEGPRSFPGVGGLRKAPPKAKVLSGQIRSLLHLSREEAGQRECGAEEAGDTGPARTPEAGGRRPRWSAAGCPAAALRVATGPLTSLLRAGGPRVKRGGSPRRGAAPGPGMLSQDSDFLSKCLDFLEPAPSAAERDRPSRARRCGLLPSAHGRPPLPAPRSAPAPRCRRRRRGRALCARAAPGPRLPPRRLLPPPPPPPPAFRCESRDRPAEGSRGAGVCAAAREPPPNPRWNNAQRPARSR